MSQKQITLLTLMLLLMAGLVIAPGASAHGWGQAESFRSEFRQGLARGGRMSGMGMHGMMGMHLGQRLDLTDEQRIELRQHRQEWMRQHHQAMEDFMGMSHEEMMERIRQGETMGDILREQGKTPAELEAFLQSQAEKRMADVDQVVELPDQVKLTLRERIAEMIQRMSDRLFD